MQWLEMSRDVDHGGPGWEFGTCLWSPTERKGGGKWGYWDLMKRIRKGDVIVHLQGKTNQHFIGHSIVDADCYITDRRPPKPGAWNHASTFYRVPIRDYCPFEKPIPLVDIFTRQGDHLMQYHYLHSPASSSNGRFLFFVSQAGRLQCQNGAYLSELDAELTKIIFGTTASDHTSASINTCSGFATLHTRIGQQAFSQAVRENYSGVCCFPECHVNDSGFLIGAHIARWSDFPEHRGNVANGLCLCLMHDKAFEIGLFVLDTQFRVTPSPLINGSSWAAANIVPFANQQIKIGRVRPALACLQLHWQSVGYTPLNKGD